VTTAFALKEAKKVRIPSKTPTLTPQREEIIVPGFIIVINVKCIVTGLQLVIYNRVQRYN
jgi:hypothetical protein